ncbi:MAG: 2-dehydropantoate 2-reductase [Mogibacterium sp.]|nr:2-dehydropantoate 2-reductase [Mogibacterium sp.]
MKYMIIGAGGTGGAAGSHLARAGYDVTFIARGRHLEAMRADGLRVLKPDGDFTVDPVQAFTADEFIEMIRQGAHGDAGEKSGAEDLRPDVIFVCLKGYSVDGMIPFIAEAAGPDTIVIPVLNIFGTGGKMQEKLPGITVTDGCIYVASEISEPGTILMKGDILRVVFGLRRDQKDGSAAKVMPVLEKVRDDLCDAGIEGILSDNIERDALRKFSYVSPQGACGLYYDVPVGAVQKPGEVRDCFASLVQEISDIADAMGIGFGEDVVKINLDITEGLAPDMTTSLQRDIARGGSSEIDGLIYEVPRLAARCGVSVPVYEKITEELRARGL